MIKKAVFILFLIVFISCKNESKSTIIVTESSVSQTNSNKTSSITTTRSNQIVNPSETISAEVSDIPVLNFEQFEKYLQIEDDNIHVVNFWATWCAPCVKELPYFEAVNAAYKDKNVKVLLVSLDFNLKKLNSFLEKNELKSEKVLLDDPDQNAWISKVSEKWSGAIPATVIYGKGKRQFYEHSFTKAELESEIRKFINQ